MGALRPAPAPPEHPPSLFRRWGLPPLRSRAWGIAVIYAAFAGIWIYFSDQALLLVASPDDLLRFSVYKGWAFVLLTSLLLLIMMGRAYGATEEAYTSLRTQAERLRESEQRLRMVLASTMDAIIAVDDDNRIILYNDAAEMMFGCRRNQAIGQSIVQFLPGGLAPNDRGPAISEGQRVNGDRFPAEVSLSTVDAAGDGLLTLVLRDVTERLGHEREIERLNSLYAALSRINQAIGRSRSQDELLSEVCKTLCEVGSLQIAFVGRHDDDSKQIVPVTIHGDSHGFLDGIKIYSDLRPEGLGPTGTAFREDRSYICNDLYLDPATLIWRERAIALGLHACAALPIRIHDTPRAVLVVYAGECGFFKDQEVALLEEAATDLSLALENLIRKDEHRRAEATALRERQFSDAMLESMPGILYFYDQAGRFLRWNRNFETSSGYSAGEISDMHPLDFVDPADRTRVARRIDEVFSDGESSVEALLLSRDGRNTPYFFTGRRTAFEDRVCLVGVGIDISERKQAELALRESEQRYRNTLDIILEGCQLLDFDWRYVYLNDAAAIHNRRANAELLGQRMPDCWPGMVDTDVFAMLKRCMDQRQQFHQEVEVRFPDGGIGWFDLRAQPVPEGIFILSVDITDRHHAELALLKVNENLERLVAERTTDLERALLAAKAADRLKSAFLATMSHELRTPLNSIIGFTGIVLQQLPGPLNAEQSKQLGMVRSSAQHLLALINDVLDLSKIEAGQLEMQLDDFDLPELIEQVLATVRPLAEQKGLSLEIAISPQLATFHSDARRVRQILLNLLSNAIKFTHTGSVRLSAERVDFSADASVEAAGKAGAMLRICVIDTGAGIKPEDLELLFQPFRQIDSGLTRQYEGTGLGLVICRRLADLLGGEITVASQWRQGSRFCLVLPFRTNAPDKAAHQHDPTDKTTYTNGTAP